MRNNKPAPRQWLALGWYALVTVLVLLWICPIRTGTLRAMILGDAAMVWAGGLLIWRRRPVAMVILVLVAALVGAAVLLPGRPVDSTALRGQYVSSLRGYVGTRYVWGGETHWGVDCSGLVRCALAEAEFREGMRTLNPRLLRGAFALWSRDASAMSLRDGYANRARTMGATRSLNATPANLLAPGDFAVTPSGSHTLAYLGEDTWIAADPARRIVMTYRSPDPREFWLRTPLVILRWRVLEP